MSSYNDILNDTDGNSNFENPEDPIRILYDQLDENQQDDWFRILEDSNPDELILKKLIHYSTSQQNFEVCEMANRLMIKKGFKYYKTPEFSTAMKNSLIKVIDSGLRARINLPYLIPLTDAFDSFLSNNVTEDYELDFTSLHFDIEPSVRIDDGTWLFRKVTWQLPLQLKKIKGATPRNVHRVASKEILNVNLRPFIEDGDTGSISFELIKPPDYVLPPDFSAMGY